MKRCPQARHLFGSYWDDEVTQGERDFVESHLAECTRCRQSYERLTHTLDAVASLPRTELAADLADRVLAEAKRRQRVPDVIVVPQRAQWQPLAAAAALAMVALTSVLLLRSPDRNLPLAASEPPVEQPRLVAVEFPAGAESASPSASIDAVAGAGSRAATDSLFDHSEDIEFILDPVQLRRGRAHTARLPEGVQGEQAVISF